MSSWPRLRLLVIFRDELYEPDLVLGRLEEEKVQYNAVQELTVQKKRLEFDDTRGLVVQQSRTRGSKNKVFSAEERKGARNNPKQAAL